jgi:hypothetical protein
LASKPSGEADRLPDDQPKESAPISFAGALIAFVSIPLSRGSFADFDVALPAISSVLV